MVAAIDIAVVLDDAGVAAGLGHRADARGLAHPTCQRGVEKLHEDLAHILANPFVEDGAH